jgi:uncharacterized protein YkwD
MKNKSIPFLIVSTLLFFAADGFSQNNSTVIEDTSEVAVLNRARFTDGGIKVKKTVTAFEETEKQAFELINKQRKANGLKELAWSDDAAEVARRHSQSMAEYKFFSHQGLDGSMVDDRADSLGLRKWLAIGENIAYNRGYSNPVEFAVECWMKSTGHKENILNRGWKESGIGIAVASDGSYYFTQVFLL